MEGVSGGCGMTREEFKVRCSEVSTARVPPPLRVFAVDVHRCFRRIGRKKGFGQDHALFYTREAIPDEDFSEALRQALAVEGAHAGDFLLLYNGFGYLASAAFYCYGQPSPQESLLGAGGVTTDHPLYSIHVPGGLLCLSERLIWSLKDIPAFWDFARRFGAVS